MLNIRYFKFLIGQQTNSPFSIKKNFENFCYANDVAIAIQEKYLEDCETTLSNDFHILGQYYKN